MLASLNHPGIAHLYSFEEIPSSSSSPSRHILVMELVEGETLRERMKAGGHLRARGARRRRADRARPRGGPREGDRPPRPQARERRRVEGRPREDPRLRPREALAAGRRSATSSRRPGRGRSSPRRARCSGRSATCRRSRCAASPSTGARTSSRFGTLLYELLAGKNPFRSATSAETMTAILRHDVASARGSRAGRGAGARRRSSRAASRRSRRSAFSPRKTSRSRWRTPPGRPGWRRQCWAPTPVRRGVAAARSRRPARPVSSSAPRPRFSARGAPRADPGEATSLHDSAARGRLVLLPVRVDARSPSRRTGRRSPTWRSDPKGGRRLWLRPLSALQARPLAGTEGAVSVFWSPDGASLGFFAEKKLKRLDLPGGAPVTICEDTGGGGKAGTWGRGGDILFSSVQGDAIYRVSASGGAAAVVLKPDAAAGETRVVWPWFLPDGERYLFFARTEDGGRVMLAEPGRPSRLVLKAASMVQYSDPGYLLFVNEGVLLGQRFDARSGRVSGRPVLGGRARQLLHVDGVRASFATSRGGTLVFQPQDDVHRLVWFDRSGRELGTVGPPSKLLAVFVPADGRPVLFDRARPDLGTFDVWSYDADRNVETRVTSAPDTEFGARWLPGGRTHRLLVRARPQSRISSAGTSRPARRTRSCRAAASRSPPTSRPTGRRSSTSRGPTGEPSTCGRSPSRAAEHRTASSRRRSRSTTRASRRTAASSRSSSAESGRSGGVRGSLSGARREDARLLRGSGDRPVEPGRARAPLPDPGRALHGGAGADVAVAPDRRAEGRSSSSRDARTGCPSTSRRTASASWPSSRTCWPTGSRSTSS